MPHPLRRPPIVAGALGAAILGPLLAACGDSTAPRRPGRPAPIVGTFELRLVDGQPLPVAVRTGFAGGVDFTLRSGGAAFTTDGRPGGDGQLSRSYTGEWRYARVAAP